MTRQQANELLEKNIKNINLRRHCYAVEAVMRALAKRFEENQDKWGIAGLLHDADYELTKDDTQNHTKYVTEWIKEIDTEEEIENAILSHAWGYVDGAPEPKNKMQWSLYCCDELTGLIVAIALVKPDRKLSSVTIESILKKWTEKSFARGVDREQIKKCEDYLQIPLHEFIEIALLAMQSIAPRLGL